MLKQTPLCVRLARTVRALSRMTCDASGPRRASMLVACASLMVASQGGCGGGKLASHSSPDASAYAYDDCFFTTFLQVPGGGGLDYRGGGMTLGRSGSVLTANYGDANGAGGIPAASLRSATLLPSQDATNIEVPCAPLEFTPTVAQLASGSLTYNAGTVFLSVEGTAEPVDAGSGCSNSGGPASMIVKCSDDTGGLPGADIDAGPSEGGSGSGFVGVYSCNDSDQSYRAPPGGLESGGGGTGTLTITEAGGVLTAAYADDVFIEGSLQFTAKTEGAAAPTTSNETMQVFCPGSGNPPPDGGNLYPMLVTASSLTIDGSWVVLSFVGDMPSSSGCAGLTTSVSVLCAR
jgi:hypothetical protein